MDLDLSPDAAHSTLQTIWGWMSDRAVNDPHQSGARWTLTYLPMRYRAPGRASEHVRDRPGAGSRAAIRSSSEWVLERPAQQYAPLTAQDAPRQRAAREPAPQSRPHSVRAHRQSRTDQPGCSRSPPRARQRARRCHGGPPTGPRGLLQNKHPAHAAALHPPRAGSFRSAFPAQRNAPGV